MGGFRLRRGRFHCFKSAVMSSIFPPVRALACLALGLLAIVAGRAQDCTGSVVTKVEYQPSTQPIDPRDLERMQLVQIGQPLDPRQVAATLDRLYSTGLYDDLQVDAQAGGNGDVRLRFLTVPRRFIGHVGAHGRLNDPPSRAVVISGAQLNLGSAFDQEALTTAQKSIEQEMRRNGLFEA